MPTTNDRVLAEFHEVEALARECTGVHDAAVECGGVPGAGRRLVAYVVMTKKTPCPVGRLRAWLPGRLVPSVFVALEAMPLTSGGQIDRTKLSTSPGSVMGFAREFIQPRTPTERQLADIWERVFETDRAGIDDNFFELGGDSLHGLQILSQMPDVVGADADLALLFDKPTVRALAAAIELRRSETRVTR